MDELNEELRVFFNNYKITETGLMITIGQVCRDWGHKQFALGRSLGYREGYDDGEHEEEFKNSQD